VSLTFLKAAIRRSALFCCIMTVVGFLVGCGLYINFPAPYQASTSLLLTYGPYENGPGAPYDTQAIAQTRTVATLAMHKLGLQQDAGSLLAAYRVTIVSNRMFLITFTAPSASQALRGANAVATEFLLFRAGELQQAQEQVSASLNQQVSQAKQKLSSIRAQISQVSAQPTSPVQQSRLSGLQEALSSATTTLTNLQQDANGNEATNQSATAAAIKGSQVLGGATLLPRSHLRHLLLYPGAGLIGGLVVGIAIVLIRAIVSDRLRRRDDVADALGAPVKLSTGPLQPNRRRLVRRGRGAAREADIRRIAAHLGGAVPENVRGTAALAVVAVDDPEAAALPVVSLATSCTQHGQRIVLADLASGAPAARLLGVREPGVGVVSVEDARLVVAVPERDDVAPPGPLGHVPARDQRSSFTDAVAAACAEADMLLTLLTLDPSFGGEHLQTWAANAVVVVTAGRSSWTKINAVGEMIRLSGTRLASAVLIGADKTDESLGVVSGQQVGRAAEIAEQGPNFSGNGSRLTADEIQGRHRSAAGDSPRSVNTV
jgi:capsular polysaccharide biosynthesis protein